MGSRISVDECASTDNQRVRDCCHLEGETPIEIRIAYQQPRSAQRIANFAQSGGTLATGGFGSTGSTDGSAPLGEASGHLVGAAPYEGHTSIYGIRSASGVHEQHHHHHYHHHHHHGPCHDGSGGGSVMGDPSYAYGQTAPWAMSRQMSERQPLRQWRQEQQELVQREYRSYSQRDPRNEGTRIPWNGGDGGLSRDGGIVGSTGSYAPAECVDSSQVFRGSTTSNLPPPSSSQSHSERVGSVDSDSDDFDPETFVAPPDSEGEEQVASRENGKGRPFATQSDSANVVASKVVEKSDEYHFPEIIRVKRVRHGCSIPRTCEAVCSQRSGPSRNVSISSPSSPSQANVEAAKCQMSPGGLWPHGASREEPPLWPGPSLGGSPATERGATMRRVTLTWPPPQRGGSVVAPGEELHTQL